MSGMLATKQEEKRMPGIKLEDVDDLVTYHAPDADEIARISVLRRGAANFIKDILTCAPASADQTAAIRKVREALMTANAAIVLRGRV